MQIFSISIGKYGLKHSPDSNSGNQDRCNRPAWLKLTTISSARRYISRSLQSTKMVKLLGSLQLDATYQDRCNLPAWLKLTKISSARRYKLGSIP